MTSVCIGRKGSNTWSGVNWKWKRNQENAIVPIRVFIFNTPSLYCPYHASPTSAPNQRFVKDGGGGGGEDAAHPYGALIRRFGLILLFVKNVHCIPSQMHPCCGSNLTCIAHFLIPFTKACDPAPNSPVLRLKPYELHRPPENVPITWMAWPPLYYG